MARVVPAHRRGLGFGVKQAAIPVAIMLSGIAVPLVGAAVGWRWTFALTGCAGLVLAGRGVCLPRQEGARASTDEVLDQPPLAALLTTMAAILLASAAANSLGSFLASWGYHVGLTPSQAGALMAVGSGLNILVRVGSGHLADRRHGRNLPVVALQMAIGAVALAVLALPVPASVVGGALVAFALGWSWPGLLLYAVVRIGRDAPARASGVIQAGAFAGGAAGPAVFGVVVAAAGYSTAWLCAAGLFGAAALLIVVARRMFIADLVARPPARPLGYGGGRTSPARTTQPEQGAR
jgi:predicted MFS family arabinose efflux permease